MLLGEQLPRVSAAFAICTTFHFHRRPSATPEWCRRRGEHYLSKVVNTVDFPRIFMRFTTRVPRWRRLRVDNLLIVRSNPLPPRFTNSLKILIFTIMDHLSKVTHRFDLLDKLAPITTQIPRKCSLMRHFRRFGAPRRPYSRINRASERSSGRVLPL